MDGTGNSFRYEPLTEPDSIRLLILQPGSPGSVLSGSLVHTTLAECHYDIHFPYTALSYVWGDASKTAKIIIHSQPFTITASLASALDNLRDERTGTRIWVDAVCIDQSNIAERNQQVGLMREVYSFAQQTIVYLGEADGEAREIFGILKQQKIVSSGLLNVPDKIRDLVAVRILSRPWFNRVWIYQELVLSREVWVQLGRDRMLWDDFCVHLLGSVDREDGTSDGEDPDDGEDSSDVEDADDVQNVPRNVPRDVQSNLAMLSAMREARHSYRKFKLIRKERPASLFSVLDARRGFQVIDLRDMVYGHHAVAAVDCGTLVADYNKSVVEVFTDASSYLVKSLGAGILSRVEMLNGNIRMEGLPSWVPDWSQSIGGNMAPIPRITRTDHYAVTSRAYSITRSMLAFNAIPLASIKKTSEVLSSTDEDYEKWFEVDGVRPISRNGVKMSKEILSAIRQEWQRYLDDQLSGSRPLYARDKMIDIYWVQFTSSLDFSIPLGTFFNRFMRHMFQIDTPSIFHGRKISLLSGLQDPFCYAVVPAATRSGDVIYIIHAIKEIHAIVLRPCEKIDIGDADKKLLRQKLSAGVPLGDKICPKHFLFIGIAWVDGTYETRSPDLLQCIASFTGNRGYGPHLPKEIIVLH